RSRPPPYDERSDPARDCAPPPTKSSGSVRSPRKSCHYGPRWACKCWMRASDISDGSSVETQTYRMHAHRPMVSTDRNSRAAIKLRQHEVAVAERLGGGEAAVGGAQDHVDQGVAGLFKRHLAAQDAGHVEVDVLRHGAHRARIAGDLDHRQDRVADDVALASGEGVHHVAGGAHEGD